MPDIPFAGLMPPAVHRLALKLGERARRIWWRWRKPQLRGCALVPLNAEGHVLMVRHSYRARAEWQLVTGGVDKGETHEQAAARELDEEVGLKARTLTQVLREPVEMHGASNDVVVFLARVEGAFRIDNREIAEARFFAPDALPAAMSEWARRYVEAALKRRG
ncbi:NUDIX domain-containing protein [Croceicoccus marinus]|uniref:NUDIX domain-containing protein n=1 Tax=Croceicoccus marinus TaxID=450378 RepID=A0A7G6VSJ0_9SPHN|nr:NUDIX domain-containing protein [Croceicoccus marinus]QNE04705.1 NUDIX domain-containing protein [Croceicoccus marinus]